MSGLEAGPTGAMVMLVLVLAATGTAATAITVAVADPPLAGDGIRAGVTVRVTLVSGLPRPP